MAEGHSTARVQGDDLGFQPGLCCDSLLKAEATPRLLALLYLQLGLGWPGAAPEMLPDLSPQQLVPHVWRLGARGDGGTHSFALMVMGRASIHGRCSAAVLHT